MFLFVVKVIGQVALWFLCLAGGVFLALSGFALLREIRRDRLRLAKILMGLPDPEPDPWTGPAVAEARPVPVLWEGPPLDHRILACLEEPAGLDGPDAPPEVIVEPLPIDIRLDIDEEARKARRNRLFSYHPPDLIGVMRAVAVTECGQLFAGPKIEALVPWRHPEFLDVIDEVYVVFAEWTVPVDAVFSSVVLIQYDHGEDAWFFVTEVPLMPHRTMHTFDSGSLNLTLKREALA